MSFEFWLGVAVGALGGVSVLVLLLWIDAKRAERHVRSLERMK